MDKEELPLVSIVIPTYNGDEFLEATLESAISQTYKNVEILICDDGSIDKTIEISKRYELNYPQVRLIQNPVNLGMVANWNSSILKVKSDWIKFLFQDDILQPECVELMLTACIKHDLNVAVCRRDFIIHDDVAPHLQKGFKTTIVKPEHLFLDKEVITPDELAKTAKRYLIHNVIGEPTCYLFNKAVLKETGMFNLLQKQLVDYEFIVRIGLLNGFVFLSDTLAFFRVHGKSVSSDNNKRDKPNRLKSIAAESGDALLMLEYYLKDPAFELIKKEVGEDILKTYQQHLFYSGSKHKGRKIFKKALEPLFKQQNWPILKYTFFKYVYYRHLIRKWEKEMKKNNMISVP